MRNALVSTCALLSFSLACSGLPVGEPAPAPVPAPAPAPEPEPEPEPEPVSPESLFQALDPDEAPPFEKPSLKCPQGTSVIKNPKGGRLRIYCAQGNGTPSGPYTEWQGSGLRTSGTKQEGKREGPFTEWTGSGSKARKISEQHYVGDVAEGDYASWDEAGHLLVRGKMHEGKRHGRFIESTVEGESVTFGGACYGAGEELWRTTDPAEFTTKECAEAPSEET